MTPLWLLQQWCWTYDTVQSMFHVPICATNICMCFFLRRKILQQPVKGHLWYGYAPLNCICIGKMVTNHRKFTSSLVFQKKTILSSELQGSCVQFALVWWPAYVFALVSSKSVLVSICSNCVFNFQPHDYHDFRSWRCCWHVWYEGPKTISGNQFFLSVGAGTQ
jgi:hypothetical protein